MTASRSSPPRSRADERDALVRAAEAAFEAGEFVKAAQLGRAAVAAADALPEGVLRASARRFLALSLLYIDRADEAERFAAEAARIAHAARTRGEEALAMRALSEIAQGRGDYVAGLRHAARARHFALRAADPWTTQSVLADYALLLSRVGDGERAREVCDEALAIPAHGQPPMRAFRILYNAGMMHRAAGRYDEALRMMDRAERTIPIAGLRAIDWSLTSVRLITYADIGAFEEMTELLDARMPTANTPSWQQAQHWMFRALVALLAGERPEAVEDLTERGLSLSGIELMVRFPLERIRGIALLGRGRNEEAERIGLEWVARAAKGGTKGVAAQAMALAARAGHPEVATQRWMTALALASGGVMARTEFEALAALSGDAEPIGTLARTSLAVVRSRLVERTPTHLRSLCKKTLRQLEAKLVAQRSSRRQEVVTTLSEETLKAKEELGIVGSSPALLRAIGTVARAARSDTSMVITGETGAGKELFARLAHRLSRRKDGPFVALNCAAIPEPLLEAELFGHERGAFTGAERSRTGLFVEAEHGTLFLDEVGEMSPGMQAKLLRVLEDGQVRPVGGTRARKVDVRVITATHRDLSAMVESRQFREDLFYRLAALTVRLPALRERAEDIPAIARALLHRDPATRRHKLDVSALAALAEHSWPGNVRELANVMRVAAAMADERTIGRAELSIAIGGDTRRGAHGASPLEETTLAALRDRHRAEVRELVGRAIAAHDGNKLQAARALGISRQGLYRVLEEIGE